MAIQRASRGFTIIELLVVIAVIGILVTIGIVSYNSLVSRNNDQLVKNGLKYQLQLIDKYQSERGRYPAALSELASSNNAPSGNVQYAYFYDSAGETFCLSGKLASGTTPGFRLNQSNDEPQSGECTEAPPAFGTITLSTGNVGSPYSTSIPVTGTGTITYSSTNLPPGLSMSASTGNISGTPTVAGTYTIILTATNGGGTSTATTSLVVTP